MELAALRESMRKLEPAARPGSARADGVIATGFAALDRLLRGGGMVRGQVIEVAGPPSSGKTSLALGAIAGQTRAGALAAFVDARGDLYPPAAAALGVELSRLLIARLPAREGAAGDAVRAAEILARARAFPLIAIALPRGAEIAHAAARRLRAAAHRGGVAIAVLADRGGAVDGAGARLELTAGRAPRRGRRLSAIVNKGSRSGGPERAELSLSAIQIDDAPPTALPAATARRVPGALPEPEIATAGVPS